MSKIRIFLLLASLLAAAFYSFSNVTFNVDILALLPGDLYEVEGVRKLYKHFSRETELIVTLKGEDADRCREAAGKIASHLGERTDLARDVIWQLPLDGEPADAADVLAWLWLNGSPQEVRQLEARLSPENSAKTIDETLEALSEGLFDESTMIRSYDPLGLTDVPGGLKSLETPSSTGQQDPFASPDGAFRMLYVEAAPEGFANYKEMVPWLAGVRQVIAGALADYEAEHPGAAPVTVQYTGEPAFVAEISTGMERDMKGSITATAILIGLLFWLMHRQLRPLLWLAIMVSLIFILTLTAGGLIFGELSVMSVGFAAILIGLAVDYGVVIYQEGVLSRGDTRALRRQIGPSILWAAITTAVVFFSLNFSSLPGVSELGNLVAIGILFGGIVMLGLFTPVATRFLPANEKQTPSPAAEKRTNARLLGLGTALPLLLVGGLVWIKGAPHLNREFEPMQLRDSASMAALEELNEQMGRDDRSSCQVVATTHDLKNLPDLVNGAKEKLEAAQARGEVSKLFLAPQLVPSPVHQHANAAALATLAEEWPRLRQEILDAGFTEDALLVGQAITSAWKSLAARIDAAEAPQAIIPESGWGRWMIERFYSGAEGEYAAMGIVTLADDGMPSDFKELLAASPEKGEVYLAGWEALTPAIEPLVEGDFVRVFLPMGLVLMLVLGLVYRDWRDLSLTLFSLVFSTLVILGITLLFDIEWNFFNLFSIPIMFGTGLDYSIHMIFALRREKGDLPTIRRGITRALLFCGGSTCIGFASLSFAASQGLSSLGQLCGIGILVNMLCAVIFLPHWWRFTRGMSGSQTT